MGPKIMLSDASAEAIAKQLAPLVAEALKNPPPKAETAPATEEASEQETSQATESEPRRSRGR